MSEVPSTVPEWWGSFELPLKAARAWRVGGFRLHLRRTEEEIRVSWWEEGDPVAPTLVVDARAEELPPAAAQLARFGFRQAPQTVRLVPATADRPIVATPVHPFRLPPREQATIYVSAPLWLRLTDVGDQTLFEQPLHRPSDTWFGANTRVGEVCYASRTAARLNLSNIPVLPQRAVSAVRIHNQAPTVLELERLKLPAPALSLHAGENGHLWTEGVTLVREADGDLAALKLDKGPPPEAGRTTFLQGPRSRTARGTPLRVFGRMLRRGGVDA